MNKIAKIKPEFLPLISRSLYMDCMVYGPYITHDEEDSYMNDLRVKERTEKGGLSVFATCSITSEMIQLYTVISPYDGWVEWRHGPFSASQAGEYFLICGNDKSFVVGNTDPVTLEIIYEQPSAHWKPAYIKQLSEAKEGGW